MRVSDQHYYSSDSQVCYVYLADVDVRSLHTFNTPANRGFNFRSQMNTEPSHSNTLFNNQILPILSKSRWFTRGWTLQELLAPSHEVFFANDWSTLGDRNDMSTWIAHITRIHIGALRDRSTIQRYSIAQRMSWAATRETTRAEDIAYCLLGIFNIHMPMLYGEGEAAFHRLQREIMGTTDDHSIFAWDIQANPGELCTGALATCPKAFLSCGSVVRDSTIRRYPFTVTNLGLSIELPLIQSWHDRIYLVGLNCARELRGHDDPLDALPSLRTLCRDFQAWIFLRHVEHNIYQRIHMPASTVFLQQSYLNRVQMAETSLFIEIHTSPHNNPLPLPNPLVPPIPKSIQASPVSSGLMMILGWGNMNKFHRYEQAFNFGQIYSQTLKGRSPMGISHQIMSNRNFSLLFSVVWNQKMQPQHWAYSGFEDIAQKFCSVIMSEEKWKYLFDDGMRASTGELGHLVDLVSDVHNQMRREFRGAFQKASRSPHSPLVSISGQELQNLHGQYELLVDINFREKPQHVFQ